MELKHKVRIAISDKFFDAFSKLPKNAQNKMSEFLNRFRQNPTSPGLNYEKVTNARDKHLKSVRIDQAHRAILLAPESGDVYVLLWVDKHDDAYAWAARQICEVNQISGALQVVDVAMVEATTEKITKTVKNKQPRLFAEISDHDLMRLGVPEISLAAIRQVITDEDLETILPSLPIEASDALIMLAAGYGINDVFNQLEKQKESAAVDPQDFARALENLDSLSRFMIITDDTALEEMLAAPLEKWRVFLHPSQRKLVEKDWGGAVRVLGGAGTGKTVVAIHRAKWLAQQRFVQANERILFTTFTSNLAVDIRANLKSICSPDILRRIKVENLDAWVAEFLRQEGYNTKIVYGEETKELWEKATALAPIELGLPQQFYEEEWRSIIQAQGYQNLPEYLVARRPGRGTRLSRQQRGQVWGVFEEYRNLLLEKGWREPEDAMRDVAQIIEQKGAEALPFKAVIVDEAQDINEAAFRLLRAVAGPAHDNDIFIVGDPHQRIYGKKAVLSQCGIDIRGRSKKLRLNYRTTDEIRRWATDILTGMDVDDMDGGQDSLQDYRSLMHGEHPVVKGFAKFEEEVQYLKQFITSIPEEKLSGVCLMLRTNQLLDRYEQILKEAGILTKQIKRSKADNPADLGVRLGTMHRVKGLQFEYVVLPGLNQDVLPLKSVLTKTVDDMSKELAISGERSLLHVAATRAKKQVLVTYYGQPCPFLQI
jgi:superfamily I DNA/RNA helicase/mRNA-degrading endonuclease RelE of RelBE toxin-antitoxin system